MRDWIYLQNAFEGSTANSYSHCLKIAHHTSFALHGQIANPLFQTLYDELQPFVDAYQTAYIEWNVQKGRQKGNTFGLSQLLDELRSTKIQEWDIQIQNLFRQGSPEYIGLLRQRRKPFQKGSQEDIISEVGALILGLQKVPALAATLQDAEAFYALLIAAFDLQMQYKGGTKLYSMAVENARVAVCTELYGVLGALMRHYKDAPHRVATFFDTETIRRHEQSSYRHNIKAGVTRLALTHTFEADDALRIINRGASELVFSLCANVRSVVAEPSVSVAPMSEIRVLAEDLGEVETHRFLKVKNLSDVDDGAYTLKLL